MEDTEQIAPKTEFASEAEYQKYLDRIRVAIDDMQLRINNAAKEMDSQPIAQDAIKVANVEPQPVDKSGKRANQPKRAIVPASRKVVKSKVPVVSVTSAGTRPYISQMR